MHFGSARLLREDTGGLVSVTSEIWLLRWKSAAWLPGGYDYGGEILINDQ